MSSVYLGNQRFTVVPAGIAEFPQIDSRFTDSAFEELSNEQLYKMLDNAKKEIIHTQLENLLLEDFLQKNDPKLLIGVTNALQVSQKTPKIHFTGLGSRERHDDFGGYMRTRSTDRGSFSGMVIDDSSSIKTVLSRRAAASVRTIESPRVTMDNRINYIMKIELAEKFCEEIDGKVTAVESRTLSEMKDLTSSIQEWKTRNEEAAQTKDAFQKFLNSLALDQINSRIPAEKFIRFIDDWIKNGMALVGKIRLRLTALKQQFQSQKIVLNKKADLSDILRPIDFEQLQIEKAKCVKQTEVKNNHLVALKRVTGNAGLLLNKNQKKLKSTEDYYKKLISEAASIEEHISRLEKEGNLVQNDLLKCEESIEKLHNDMNNFAAPSTFDYVNVKHELTCVEKEKKYLKRQNYILGIKLSNMRAKHRKSFNRASELIHNGLNVFDIHSD